VSPDLEATLTVPSRDGRPTSPNRCAHREGLVTAVAARGPQAEPQPVKSKGEVAALAETINSMTATWRPSPIQVTSVAREVRRGGAAWRQANVPGAVRVPGRYLTGNVNLLAANLTTTGARHRRSGDPRCQRVT